MSSLPLNSASSPSGAVPRSSPIPLQGALLDECRTKTVTGPTSPSRTRSTPHSSFSRGTRRESATANCAPRPALGSPQVSPQGRCLGCFHVAPPRLSDSVSLYLHHSPHAS